LEDGRMGGWEDGKDSRMVRIVGWEDAMTG
jgi:hypothetical protein